MKKSSSRESAIPPADAPRLGGTATSTFTSDGKLGIGTTSPLTASHVNGGLGSNDLGVGSTTAETDSSEPAAEPELELELELEASNDNAPPEQATKCGWSSTCLLALKCPTQKICATILPEQNGFTSTPMLQQLRAQKLTSEVPHALARMPLSLRDEPFPVVPWNLGPLGGLPISGRLPFSTLRHTGAVAAEYYVVQEKTTKECKIVETRPTETTWVQVGPLAFKTRDEAELSRAPNAVKTDHGCENPPSA